MKLFKDHYTDKTITKESIFYYVFAVLNNPNYRDKYKDNLKLELPKIPFYKDFWKWVEFGKNIAEIQINFNEAELYPIVREESEYKGNLKTIFKVDRIKGEIKLDEKTTLKEIPIEIFNFQLGIRSAVEWILDQYKVKAIKDETITTMFNDYNYKKHKEEIIVLIQKVITISLNTLTVSKLMQDIDKLGI